MQYIPPKSRSLLPDLHGITSQRAYRLSYTSVPLFFSTIFVIFLFLSLYSVSSSYVSFVQLGVHTVPHSLQKPRTAASYSAVPLVYLPLALVASGRGTRQVVFRTATAISVRILWLETLCSSTTRSGKLK
jgi:hypothetical protein